MEPDNVKNMTISSDRMPRKQLTTIAGYFDCGKVQLYERAPGRRA